MLCRFTIDCAMQDIVAAFGPVTACDHEPSLEQALAAERFTVDMVVPPWVPLPLAGLQHTGAKQHDDDCAGAAMRWTPTTHMLWPDVIAQVPISPRLARRPAQAHGVAEQVQLMQHSFDLDAMSSMSNGCEEKCSGNGGWGEVNGLAGDSTAMRSAQFVNFVCGTDELSGFPQSHAGVHPRCFAIMSARTLALDMHCRA